MARMHQVVEATTAHLETYEITQAGRLITDFVNDVSTWYLRRSRDRYKDGGTEAAQAVQTLHIVLHTLARLLAPFAPFFAEKLYAETGGKQKSVHLEPWPVAKDYPANEVIIRAMANLRQAVELGHALRKEHSIKVRQPLAQFIIKGEKLPADITGVIQDELNVREVIATSALPSGSEFVRKESNGVAVALDTTITDELRQEGMVRDIIRHINAMRKGMKLTPADKIDIRFWTETPDAIEVLSRYADMISQGTAAVSISTLAAKPAETEPLVLGEQSIAFHIVKVE